MDKQTAINALEKRFQQEFKKLGYDDYKSADERTQLVCDGISEAIDVIDTLPSAEPEILACGQGELVQDSISRQLAIDEFNCCELTPDGGIDANHAIDVLKQLPSAEPQRKTGKWIQSASHYYCSECGEPCATYIMENPRDNFCKWCGADMRVKK